MFATLQNHCWNEFFEASLKIWWIIHWNASNRLGDLEWVECSGYDHYIQSYQNCTITMSYTGYIGNRVHTSSLVSIRHT